MVKSRRYEFRIFSFRGRYNELITYLNSIGCTRAVVKESNEESEKPLYLRVIVPEFKKGKLTQALKRAKHQFETREISLVIAKSTKKQKNLSSFGTIA